MLEKLLKSYLEIETRTNSKGIEEKISLNSRKDLAYIRSQFKRQLIKANPKEIRMLNNYYQATVLNLKCSCLDPLNVTVLKDREKILIIITNWIAEEKRVGNEPMKLELI